MQIFDGSAELCEPGRHVSKYRVRRWRIGGWTVKSKQKAEGAGEIVDGSAETEMNGVIFDILMRIWLLIRWLKV